MTVTIIHFQKICKKKGKEEASFVELSLPTGYGKTFASLAYALEHAKNFHKSRIIVALPLMNLTAEMSQTYKSIFNEEHVVEDYSLAPDEELSEDIRERNKAARENWSRAFIVTTTIQLFNSLFSNNPQSLRKLHRLANSIFILDEYHLLPTHLLKPIMQQLDILQNRFNVTVLLVSATNLPLSESKTVKNWELSNFPKPLLQSIQERIRVKYSFIGKLENKHIVERIDHRATLCIVNTRQKAQQLYHSIKINFPNREVYYISTTLIGKVRAKRLCDIKSSISNNQYPIVVSTQLLEAGVDISFEVVYREMAPLPSVIQAAGRCNRYGKEPLGYVYLFYFVNSLQLRGMYQAGTAQLERLINEYGIDHFFSIEAQKSYHRRMLSIYARENPLPELPFLFESVANAFQMIDNYQIDVICTNAPGFDKNRLSKPRNRPWWQYVQQFTVPLSPNYPGIQHEDGVYLWHGEYDDQIGIPLTFKGGVSK